VIRQRVPPVAYTTSPPSVDDKSLVDRHTRPVNGNVGLEQPTTSRHSRLIGQIAALMALEAASLAVAATLHLSGHAHGRGKSFNPDGAGIAEAIIGAVLLVGALAMIRAPVRARSIGIVLNGFAAAGFLFGLSFTARGGDAPDIAYHLVVLPLLIGSVIALARATPPAAGDGRPAGTPKAEVR
jgi:hypothetical protein